MRLETQKTYCARLCNYLSFDRVSTLSFIRIKGSLYSVRQESGNQIMSETVLLPCCSLVGKILVAHHGHTFEHAANLHSLST